MNDEVWKVFWSCLSSVMLFRMCLTSLSKLVLAAMRVVFQNASFFSLKSKCQVGLQAYAGPLNMLQSFSLISGISP